jgi:hypothetical protein
LRSLDACLALRSLGSLRPETLSSLSPFGTLRPLGSLRPETLDTLRTLWASLAYRTLRSLTALRSGDALRPLDFTDVVPVGRSTRASMTGRTRPDMTVAGRVDRRNPQIADGVRPRQCLQRGQISD